MNHILYTSHELLGLKLSDDNHPVESVVTQKDVQEVMEIGIPYANKEKKLICMDKPRCLLLDKNIPEEIFEEGIWAKAGSTHTNRGASWRFITPRDIAVCLLITKIEGLHVDYPRGKKRTPADRKQGGHSTLNARSFSDKECAVILVMAYEYVAHIKNKSGDVYEEGK